MSANPVQNPLQMSAVGSGRRVSQPPKRHDFSKIKTAVRIPNLIEIQRDSYNRFLQMDFRPSSARSSRLPIFAARRSWTSSSITSATGSASAAVWKACAICARTAKTAARSSKSTRSFRARRSATTAARLTPSVRRFATTAASQWASSTSTTSRNVRNAG
jgi:DNA-directed RNA polymerase beta subunit